MPPLQPALGTHVHDGVFFWLNNEYKFRVSPLHTPSHQLGGETNTTLQPRQRMPQVLPSDLG